MMVGARDEREQLRDAVERLSVQYPTLSAATIADVVQELHDRFSGARIREFVPLFVERHARTALAELSVDYDSMALPSR
ncbi:MAG: hypothetical protein KDB55_10430 [Mycobacterium sp.]|nr:hypothetical protein [Mycobacterium sp.]